MLTSLGVSVIAAGTLLLAFGDFCYVQKNFYRRMDNTTLRRQRDRCQ